MVAAFSVAAKFGDSGEMLELIFEMVGNEVGFEYDRGRAKFQAKFRSAPGIKGNGPSVGVKIDHGKLLDYAMQHAAERDSAKFKVVKDPTAGRSIEFENFGKSIEEHHRKCGPG